MYVASDTSSVHLYFYISSNPFRYRILNDHRSVRWLSSMKHWRKLSLRYGLSMRSVMRFIRLMCGKTDGLWAVSQEVLEWKCECRTRERQFLAGFAISFKTRTRTCSQLHSLVFLFYLVSSLHHHSASSFARIIIFSPKCTTGESFALMHAQS